MKLRFSFNKDPSEAHLVSKGPFVEDHLGYYMFHVLSSDDCGFLPQ